LTTLVLTTFFFVGDDDVTRGDFGDVTRGDFDDEVIGVGETSSAKLSIDLGRVVARDASRLKKVSKFYSQSIIF
jgi:hypothetical protein